MRLEVPRRRSARPSLLGVTGLDEDNDDWRSDQERSQKLGSVPQNSGSRLPLRPSQRLIHLSPDSPAPRSKRDFDYGTQAMSHDDDFSDRDIYRSRGAGGAGAKRQTGRYCPAEK